MSIPSVDTIKMIERARANAREYGIKDDIFICRNRQDCGEQARTEICPWCYRLRVDDPRPAVKVAEEYEKSGMPQ